MPENIKNRKDYVIDYFGCSFPQKLKNSIIDNLRLPLHHETPCRLHFVNICLIGKLETVLKYLTLTLFFLSGRCKLQAAKEYSTDCL